MSPRKSSTSSAEPTRVARPRYLGLEVAGEHFPPLSPRAWEHLLGERLAAAGPPALRFRVIRSDARRAIVEVDHRAALRARSAWEATGSGPAVRSRRTWGTLVGAKAWLRSPPTAVRAGADPRTASRPLS